MRLKNYTTPPGNMEFPVCTILNVVFQRNTVALQVNDKAGMDTSSLYSRMPITTEMNNLASTVLSRVQTKLSI